MEDEPEGMFEAVKKPTVPRKRRSMVYECTVCNTVTHRDDLIVKRAVYKTMGEEGRTLKSRTVAWICPVCIEGDPEWNREKTSSSPGVMSR
jgi:rubrerythrin